MEKEFTTDVLNGTTVKELQDKYGISRRTVYAWKKKWGLTGKSPNSQQRAINKELGVKVCTQCKEVKSFTEFYANGYQPNGNQKFKGKCKSCDTQYRGDYRINFIKSVLTSMHKKYACEICGYNKNSAALCFHHLDSKEKDFGIAELSKTSTAGLEEEIRKCMLLCHNCHMEIHYPHRMIVDVN